MSSSGFSSDETSYGLELEGVERNTGRNAIVPIGGKLPYVFEMQTTKLLDVILALSP